MNLIIGVFVLLCCNLRITFAYTDIQSHTEIDVVQAINIYPTK
jgi:hypothetical protein